MDDTVLAPVKHCLLIVTFACIEMTIHINTAFTEVLWCCLIYSLLLFSANDDSTVVVTSTFRPELRLDAFMGTTSWPKVRLFHPPIAINIIALYTLYAMKHYLSAKDYSPIVDFHAQSASLWLTNETRRQRSNEVPRDVTLPMLTMTQLRTYCRLTVA